MPYINIPLTHASSSFISSSHISQALKLSNSKNVAAVLHVLNPWLFFLAPQLIANCGTRRVHKGRGTFHVNCPPPCTALLALCTRQAQLLPQPGGLLRAKVSFRVSLKVSVFGFRFSFSSALLLLRFCANSKLISAFVCECGLSFLYLAN